LTEEDLKAFLSQERYLDGNARNDLEDDEDDEDYEDEEEYYDEHDHYEGE